MLIADEFRMIDFNILNKVLRKFLTAPRQPKYLNKPEYAHLQERNKEVYLSSAWYQHHWSWAKLKAYYTAMIKGQSYFVCGLPYELAIKEGLLMREQVEDEMSESDWDSVAWEMEMECLFFGESEKAFFKFEDLEKNRKIISPLYPKSFYNVIKDKNFALENKKSGELRILSCDIAMMEGKKNDASVFTVLRLIPTKTGYDRYVSYIETIEGGHTTDQAIRIRQIFDECECDYLVLDTQNAGVSVFDQLVQPLNDPELGKEYEPWTCMNDEKMANRCSYPDAPAIIYSMKADMRINSDAAISLKDMLKRGRMRLPVGEPEGREFFGKIKAFNNAPEFYRAKIIGTYTQTTFLVNEMINLEGDRLESGLLRLREPSTKRKDRYSSLAYGNYFANELERDYLKNDEEDVDYLAYLM